MGGSLCWWRGLSRRRARRSNGSYYPERNIRGQCPVSHPEEHQVCSSGQPRLPEADQDRALPTKNGRSLVGGLLLCLESVHCTSSRAVSHRSVSYQRLSWFCSATLSPPENDPRRTITTQC